MSCVRSWCTPTSTAVNVVAAVAVGVGVAVAVGFVVAVAVGVGAEVTVCVDAEPVRSALESLLFELLLLQQAWVELCVDVVVGVVVAVCVGAMSAFRFWNCCCWNCLCRNCWRWNWWDWNCQVCPDASCGDVGFGAAVAVCVRAMGAVSV